MNVAATRCRKYRFPFRTARRTGDIHAHDVLCPRTHLVRTRVATSNMEGCIDPGLERDDITTAALLNAARRAHRWELALGALALGTRGSRQLAPAAIVTAG